MLTEKTYILCILQILEKYSDSENILTMKDILHKLKSEYQIEVERRTIYRNVDALIQMGYDISTFDENGTGYFLRERPFEPSELHMLADAVFSAEFIPERQGKELIGKLKNLGSMHQTKPLGRLSCIKTNKKITNKEIFFNVECLDDAIRSKKQVHFDYTSYDLTLSQKPRRQEKYVVNPYVLYWGNGQYYLISNMVPHEGLCHFRLDRIKNICVSDAPATPIPPGIDVYEYAKSSLFMYGGGLENFTIQCDRRILNDVVDQFGDKIIILSSDEATFTTVVKATTGGMRLWATHYFETCRVLSPDWLVEDISKAIKKGMVQYGINSAD